MYGLPADFDGKMLLGRTLEQVCFSANQIALHFDGDVSIVVEGELLHQGPNLSPNGPSQVPIQTSNLMQLVENAVTEVIAEKNGTLYLSFGNNHALKIFDNLRNYESLSDPLW